MVYFHFVKTLLVGVGTLPLLALAQAAPELPPMGGCRDINYTSPYAPENLNTSIWSLVKSTRRGGSEYRGLYNKTWDLSDLPSYQPTQLLNGTLRIWGSNYLKDGDLADFWEEEFKSFQPGISIEWNLPTTAIAIPALAAKFADLSVGRPATVMDRLTYQQAFGHDLLEVTAATGSHQVYGWSPAFAIIVREDNPITRISMKELDGVFGTARGGGYNGSTWMTNYPYKRGPEDNIRFWGQLGLKGAWNNAPIHPCGQTTKANIQDVFQNLILYGSNQWVEGLRTFANYAIANGTTARWSRQVQEAARADPYSICVGSPEVVGPGLKELAVQGFDGGAYVNRTLDNIRERKYPLYNEIFFYFHNFKFTGEPLNPMVYEFLRYVLSRQGQHQIQREGRYTPLTACIVNKMRNEIEPVA